MVAGVSDHHHRRGIHGITLPIHGFSVCIYLLYISLHIFYIIPLVKSNIKLKGLQITFPLHLPANQFGHYALAPGRAPFIN